MKKLLLFIFILGFAVSAFAQDGALEIQPEVHVVIPTGTYDQNGDFTEIASTYSPMGIFVPISVLYEVIPGLQVGAIVEFDYYNEDWADASGLNQPALEVKYTSDYDVGAFVKGYLPVGTEEIVGTDPMFYFDLGVFYDGDLDFMTLYAEVVYSLNFENDNGNKQDSLEIQVKPGFKIMDGLTINLQAELDYNFNRVINSTVVDDSDGYVFSLAPGVTYQAMDMLELSLQVPFSLLGKRGLAFWGISFIAKLNLL
jgi:hypothetical protein